VEQGLRSVPHAASRATVSIKDDLKDPIAWLDRDQMVQVLGNLIGNAFAAMEDGGTLTIHMHDTPETVCIAVSDTGVGIPQQNQGKIFEPFFTTKQMGEGTGLGLAVTYGIVKMHRGDVRVESNADPAAGPTGTTFTVSLPREEETVS
jgi:signal transduction histidine kinase